MPKLTFEVEGDASHLEGIQTRVDGAIQNVIDDAVDEGLFEDEEVLVHWIWD